MTAPTFSEISTYDLFSRFPTGVVALAGHDGTTPMGMVASSFAVGVSFDPPMASLAVQNNSTTWPLLRHLPTLGISILADDQEELCRQLASRSKRDNRFNSIDYDVLPSGAIAIGGAMAFMEVEIAQEVPAGDHTMVLLNVKDFFVDETNSPIVFYRSQLTSLEQPHAVA